MTGFVHYECSCSGNVYEEWSDKGLAVICNSCDIPFPKVILIQKGDVYPNQNVELIGKEG